MVNVLSPKAVTVVLVCILVLHCFRESATAYAPREPETPEALFAELQKLELALPRTTDHATHVRMKEREQEIEHEFSDRGSEGISFLLGKLSEMNRREAAAVSGPDDTEGALEFQVSEGIAGRSPLLRYALCFMLSDLYSQAETVQRASILKAIAESYQPSTHLKDDLAGVELPVYRLGKDGVEVFIILANSPSEFNRCHSASTLRELAKGAPAIDCKSDASTRTQAIDAFRKWWNVNYSAVQWPSNVPGYFDLTPPRRK
jgi:hypothetical protein